MPLGAIYDIGLYINPTISNLNKNKNGAISFRFTNVFHAIVFPDSDSDVNFEKYSINKRTQ